MLNKYSLPSSSLACGLSSPAFTEQYQQQQMAMRFRSRVAMTHNISLLHYLCPLKEHVKSDGTFRQLAEETCTAALILVVKHWNCSFQCIVWGCTHSCCAAVTYVTCEVSRAFMNFFGIHLGS